MYKRLGRGITYAKQLTTVGKSVLGQAYRGTFPQDRHPNNLSNGDVFILNLDKAASGGSHWVGVAYVNKKFIIYDSFGRSSSRILPHFIKQIGYKYADTDRDAEQKKKQNDCGQRSLSFLIFLKQYGVAEAMRI